MPLKPGTSLGPYEVVSLLGVGGMGEVYRARDTKLNRDVALKILPEAFTLDGDRIARFRREAQVLASLNHPHIAAIYGFEDSGSTHALVLELVEGPTLADRIAQRAIPLDEALPIARQIAEALEAAHEQGIIHRDLKPANIKVRADGTAKVLDFGLAKLADPAGAALQAGPNVNVTASPTITSPAMMTGVGVILGTAAYVSPEQAKGRPADKRSDIWAFGCVLYEMLTGKRAFEGEDVSDTLASVLRSEPDWTAWPSGASGTIRVLVERCLAKDRRQRVGDISAARFVLNEVASLGLRATPVGVVSRPQPLWRRAISMAAWSVLVAGFTSLAWWTLRPSATPSSVTRFSFALGNGERFIDNFLPLVAISPDGTQIAYVASRRVYLRLLSELTSRPIPGTETAGFLGAPVFSPDGRSLAFWAQIGNTPEEARQQYAFNLKRISLSGGAAVPICRSSMPFGASWDSTGIVFGQGLTEERGIMRCSLNGGKRELIVRVEKDEIAQSPQMLPGGDAVMFTLAKGFTGNTAILTSEFWDKARIVVQPLKGGAPKTVLEGGSDGRYLPSGHLVFALGGTLLAVPFDVRLREVTGSPLSVLDGVSRPTSIGNGPATAQAGMSATGSLVYLPGPVTTSVQGALVMVDRNGGVEVLKTPSRDYRYPRVSPDGKRVAVGIGTNIWIWELAGTTAMRQLTFGGNNQFPVWMGNDLVAFQSDRDGDPSIFRQRQDGTASAERLTKAEPKTSHVPESVSPDGKTLLYDVVSQTGHALWTRSIADGKAAPFGNVQTVNAAISSTFSPDGKWIAYARTGLGGTQVFVEPYPRTGAPYLIGDGTHPLWSRDGKELSYESLGQVFTVAVATRPAFHFGTATSVSRTTVFRASQESYRDSMPDGRYLGVVAGEASGSANTQIQVVLNWLEELKQRVPTK